MDYYKKHKINRDDITCPHGVNIHDIDDEINPLWGRDAICLTENDIKALKDGKILTTSVCGEYRLFIVFDNE